MPSDVSKPAETQPATPAPAGGVEAAAAMSATPGAAGGAPVGDPPVAGAAAAPPPEPEPAAARRGVALNDAALDQLFRAARTQYGFTAAAVSDDELRAIFDLMKWGPTSANSSPARFLFLRTQSAKERLRPALSSGNLQKTMLAPVTVIVAYDPKFYDYLPRLFPHTDAKPWFTSNPELAEETAFRNGTLQGAYFMLAARALGFGLGPMSGFDNAKVDAEFLADRGWKSNFLVNLGHGDPAAEKPRGPRFWFDETCLML